MKLILKDKTELEVTSKSTGLLIVTTFNAASDIDEYRKNLSEVNLSEYSLADSTGSVIGEYRNGTLLSTKYTTIGDNFEVIYTLRQYSDTEVRLNALEKEQAVQSDAIATISESVYVAE